MDGQIVIIGAGQAGTQAAESLRSGGYIGAITMLGDEPHGPYHRPPLSKAWLAGDVEAAQLVMRSPELLAKKDTQSALIFDKLRFRFVMERAKDADSLDV